VGRKTDLLQSKAIADINLTPLMDLTFILLITFIITFPLMETGMPVKLPTATGTPLEEKDTLPITVDETGRWFVEQREVTREQFAAEMRFIKEQRPNVTLLLRGDRGLAYGKLMDVMNELQKSGLQRVSLVTQSGESVGGP
jgi:biopolymer transport protein TolR